VKKSIEESQKDKENIKLTDMEKKNDEIKGQNDNQEINQGNNIQNNNNNNNEDKKLLKK